MKDHVRDTDEGSCSRGTLMKDHVRDTDEGSCEGH